MMDLGLLESKFGILYLRRLTKQIQNLPHQCKFIRIFERLYQQGVIDTPSESCFFYQQPKLSANYCEWF